MRPESPNPEDFDGWPLPLRAAAAVAILAVALGTALAETLASWRGR